MLVGLNRVKTDQFYTKPKVAKECVSLFREHVEVGEHDLVVEPSAGCGSFVCEMRKHFKNMYACDIEPKSDPSIVCADFLANDIVFSGDYAKIHVLGNPPFGRQSSLAKQFIKKCTQFAATIAFILPRSFKKDSFKASFSQCFHLKFEQDLKPKSFCLVDGMEYDVPCVFQIWERRDSERTAIHVDPPSCFSFVRKSENPTFALRRVGGNAGSICEDSIDKNEQSHYFIRLNDDIDTNDFLVRYSKIQFQHNNTVGPKSISKKEFTAHLNKLFG